MIENFSEAIAPHPHSIVLRRQARQTEERPPGGQGPTTGFDLVAVKHSVVDEELERLGLQFTTRTAGSRRLVHGDAYDAGRAAGALFEPEAALGR